MLPELAGRSVVDLGCGVGWFSPLLEVLTRRRTERLPFQCSVTSLALMFSAQKKQVAQHTIGTRWHGTFQVALWDQFRNPVTFA